VKKGKHKKKIQAESVVKTQKIRRS